MGIAENQDSDSELTTQHPPEISVMDGKMQPPSGAGGRKRGNLTLDLNTASPKKTRIQNILTSPDVQKLNMSSPDIEKLLSQNPSLPTPWSPSAPVINTTTVFLTTPTLRPLPSWQRS